MDSWHSKSMKKFTTVSEIPPSQFLTRDFHICGSSNIFRDPTYLLDMRY